MSENDWKKLVIVIFSLLITNNIYALDNKSVPVDSVCITPENAYKLESDLYKLSNIEKIIFQIEKQNMSLQEQTRIYTEQVKILEDKVKAAELLVLFNEKLYKDSLVKQEELYKIKEKTIQDDLDEAKKPRWSTMFGSTGLGVIIAIIAVILL